MNTKTFEDIIPYVANVITNKNFVKSIEHKVSTYLGDFSHDSVKAV